jgi:hypothetical protein
VLVIVFATFGTGDQAHLAVQAVDLNRELTLIYLNLSNDSGGAQQVQPGEQKYG